MSIDNSDPNYAGVPLPEIWVQTQRLLLADTTEQVLNAIADVKKIRQINLKGESLPATINSGPNKGIANNHTERRMIKFGDREVELKHMVGDFYIEVAVENEEELQAKVEEIRAAVATVLDPKDIGFGVEVGRYSKYRPSLHDYR